MKILAVLVLLSFLAEVAISEDDQTMAVVSGELDDSTVTLMKKPRCGMRDPVGDNRRRRYVLWGTKWRKNHLTYYVQPGEDLPHDQQKQIFADALQFWADVSAMTFSEVSSASDADIKISFGKQTHGGTSVESTCPEPFDGANGNLAHASFPEDGVVHFNEDITFTHGTSSGYNLLWVAMHEFGHSLGLDHTNIKEAIMYAYYTGSNLQLHSDDIDGIQYLYGEPPAPTTSPAQVPDPTVYGKSGASSGSLFIRSRNFEVAMTMS
ncbi:hypothetical protein ACROYT_G000971 [Oculina patagonica]